MTGRIYAKNLGINLDLGGEKELFKWFLACLLFGKPIQQEVAKKTFFEFEKNNLTAPKKILDSGWNKLVKILDKGHYVRYDYSTADKLLEVCGQLLDKYGTIKNLIKASDNIKDLEKRLLELKGIGPVTAKIFIRDIKKVFFKIKNEPKRVFAGIQISKGLEKKILKLEQELNPAIPWIAPPNLHITIIPPWEENDLKYALKKLENLKGGLKRFKIVFNNLSLKYRQGKASLIFLEGEARKDALNFKPHLTLARLKSGNYENMSQKIKRQKISWEEEVFSIALFESILLPEGALYKIIKKIKLYPKEYLVP